MKKLLLSLFIIWLWLINFSSSYDCSSDSTLNVETDSYINFYYFEFPWQSASVNLDNWNINYDFVCVWTYCYINDNSTDDIVFWSLELTTWSWDLTSSWFMDCQFDLIPVSSWSSSCDDNDVQWSSLYVNNEQLTGESIIYIYTPDFLELTPEYKSWYVDLNFENVGDPEYIENVLSIQTYSPTSDDFALSFVGGLTLILPYIIITLFVIFIRKIIRKIFK